MEVTHCSTSSAVESSIDIGRTMPALFIKMVGVPSYFTSAFSFQDLGVWGTHIFYDLLCDRLHLLGVANIAIIV